MNGKQKHTGFSVPALLCGLLLAGALVAALQYAHKITYVAYPILGYTMLALIAIGALGFWHLAARGIALSFARLFPTHADFVRLILCLALGVTGLLLRMHVLLAASTDASGETGMLFTIARFASTGKLSSDLLNSYVRYLALSPSSFAYPAYLVSTVTALFGESVRALLYVNLLLTVCNIALGSALAKTVAGKRAVLPVMALFCLWPTSILAAGTITPIPYFTFFLLVALTILARFFGMGHDPAHIKHPILTLALLPLCGILIGFLPSVRPEGHVVPIAAGILMALYRTPRLAADNNRSACVILSVRSMRFVLVVLPMILTMLIMWQKLRMLIEQAPVFGLSELGYSFMVGMNALAGGAWNQADADFFTQASASAQSAFATQWAFFRTGFVRLIDDPAEVLKMILSAKRLFVWQHGDLTLAGTVGFIRNYPVQLLYVLCLTFATASAFLTSRMQKPAAKPLFTVLGMLLLFSVLFEARTEEQALILPLILAVAGGYGALPDDAVQSGIPKRGHRVRPPSHILSDAQMRDNIQNGHLRITATRAYLDDHASSGIVREGDVHIVEENEKNS